MCPLCLRIRQVRMNEESPDVSSPEMSTKSTRPSTNLLPLDQILKTFSNHFQLELSYLFKLSVLISSETEPHLFWF